MYHNPWGPSTTSPKPQPENNPFLADSHTSASQRFPALDTSQSSFQSSSSFGSRPLSPPSSQFSQPSYGIQQPQQQFGQQWSGQPQYQNVATFNQGGYSGFNGSVQAQPTGFGGYGQNYGHPSSYGGQFATPGQPQYTGYPQFQQSPSTVTSPQQYQQSLINEFDPFSNSTPSNNPSSTGGSSYNSSQYQGSTGGGQSYRTGPNGHQHPRAFIQSHKGELESWNSSAWSQAISTFEELKKAWENRRAELHKHLIAGQYLTTQDTANLKSMIKESENNIDSIAASLYQMQEVSTGYKHSLDAAGKIRVREAMNAGLRELPDWP
ncbi:hypothetical protein M422DRAFT_27089 [Sphaerobolus stellatus SS14]|nr:hypothetical protein M422DRAFT_27089 [Sphaerobolus stellatus SS14]